MAKAKFDIKTLKLPPSRQALYAGVGATDLAVEAVREYVADVQKRLAEVQKDVQSPVAGFQKTSRLRVEPKALREHDRDRSEQPRRRAAGRGPRPPEKVQTLVERERRDRRPTPTATWSSAARRSWRRIRKQEATKATAEVGQDHRRQGQDHQDAGQEGPRKTASVQREGDPDLGQEDRVQRRQEPRRTGAAKVGD